MRNKEGDEGLVARGQQQEQRSGASHQWGHTRGGGCPKGGEPVGGWVGAGNTSVRVGGSGSRWVDAKG